MTVKEDVRREGEDLVRVLRKQNRKQARKATDDRHDADIVPRRVAAGIQGVNRVQ